MTKALEQLSKREKSAYRGGPHLGMVALDTLMPLHLWIGPEGTILRAGPTIKKLGGTGRLAGRPAAEVIKIKRPAQILVPEGLFRMNGHRLKVELRGEANILLSGVVITLPKDQGLLLNLSLGIGVSEIVRRFGLKINDFAPSDPTVEMLYLLEAQSAVRNESKSLTSRLQGAKVAAEEQAFTDTLTGLKNRRALDHMTARLVDRRQPTGFGLMHLDLDYFKAVNDTHGHAAGDHVLQKAAQIFVDETRADDIVARIGGDEFVLILMNCDDLARLETVARRIIARLEKPIPFENITCRVSASIGITLSRNYQPLALEQMAQDADVALYASKNKGRACHTVFEQSPEP